jgi:hypothetical protein
MTAWILTVPHYHTESGEDPGKNEYHVGKNAENWMCSHGKRIFAEHLAEGPGDGRKKCPECVTFETTNAASQSRARRQGPH